MPKPEPGAVIAYMDCPDCNAPDKPIRLNKNGCAYFDCREIVIPQTGERCYARRSWGRVKSAEMIEQYEAVNDDGEDQTGAEGRRIEAANDNERGEESGPGEGSPANDNERELDGGGGGLAIFGWE